MEKLKKELKRFEDLDEQYMKKNFIKERIIIALKKDMHYCPLTKWYITKRNCKQLGNNKYAIPVKCQNCGKAKNNTKSLENYY